MIGAVDRLKIGRGKPAAQASAPFGFSLALIHRSCPFLAVLEEIAREIRLDGPFRETAGSRMSIF
jgi:hypothetical protein